MTTEQLNEIFATIINVLIIPLLPVLTAYLIALLKKKTAEIENRIKKEDQARYIGIAENVTATAVAAVTQTYVDEIKKLNRSMTTEQSKYALQMAKDKVLIILGVEGLKALRESVGDVDAWLENKIESYIHSSKH